MPHARCDEAEADVLAYMAFPKDHRVKLYSTNPLERMNGEIKWLTEVVRIFPNEAVTRKLPAISTPRFNPGSSRAPSEIRNALNSSVV